jgi:formate dehydrogenase major subunit
VFQVLKRHFARYTPEMVQQACGVPPESFTRICELVTENSGPDRTTAFVYSVGWTQHTVGAQYIRTAAILQLLLGNIGRPGGGILALRGHASIQGSTDIPTLFDLLPGYLPMPHVHGNEDLAAYVADEGMDKGFWANMGSYMVSLLKAYWGDAATAENDFCFDYLPRLTGSHSTYETVVEQIEGRCQGYFLFGQNPAVGSANGRMQRAGLANLDWLVVRDLVMIESATFWQNGPEIETGEMRTEDIKTEVFFLPAAAHTEKNGSFTNTQRMLQWHHEAVQPAGEARSDLWFAYHLGRRIRAKLAASADAMDRPILDLTWDYPVEGPLAEPSAEAVLAEVNGWDADGKPLSSYTQLKDDGSTSCGCWIYCGVRADGVNQAARRKPGSEQSWVAPDWGWAWPANRRILYNRASADPDGKPWSERKALVWWDADAGKWTGHDNADFVPDRPPSYRPPDGATGVDAISGLDPFILQADGKAWLFAPAGLVDGPLPAHYEPQESPGANWAPRSSPTWLPPTGSPSTTPRAACRGCCPTCRSCSRSSSARSRPSSRPSGAWRTAAGPRSSPRDPRSRPGSWSPSGSRSSRCGADGCTRSDCRTTGAPTGSAPATPPTTWRTCPWTRTCTSRRSRRWPATSGPAAARAGPRCESSCATT